MTIAAPQMSERQLMEAIIALASLLDWEVYHTFDSRKSVSGYPDLTLVRPPRLCFVETKVGRNRLTPAQERWLGRLGAIPGVECFCWRERDWLDGHIERILA